MVNSGFLNLNRLVALMQQRACWLLLSVVSVLFSLSVSVSAHADQVSTIFNQLAKSELIRADFEQQKKLASLNTDLCEIKWYTLAN